MKTKEDQQPPQALWVQPLAAVWAVLLVASSVAIWRAREYNLSHGLPCESRGTWGCGFLPPEAYAPVSLLFALPYVAVATLTWKVFRHRAPKSAAVAVTCVFLAWIAHYLVAFRAALYNL